MKVSVIIPVYNCEAYIAQTLNCIFTQNFPRNDIEVILCLDAPTDNTAAVVNSWVRAHRGINIRVLKNMTNMGAT